MPRFDSSASLRIWAIETTVGGRLLRVPPLPSADWLPAVMRMDPFAVFDLVEDFDLGEMLTDVGLSVEELRDAAVEIVEAASGRSSIAAFAIAGAAAERWDVIGADLARAGVRFDVISLGAALDAIYGSLCRSMKDEKSLAEFNRILETPTAGDVVRQSRRPRGAKPLPASALPFVRERPKTQLLPKPDPLPGQNARPNGRLRRRVDSGPEARREDQQGAGGASPLAG